jgi:hypothetical protein
MSHNSKNTNGFTLVELMLAMGFVSALLLAIAMTVIQIGHMYNSGLTYKNVNQVGNSIASEVQRSVTESSPFDINGPSKADHYVVVANGGRLCTGTYTYIWNNGVYLDPVNNPAQYSGRYQYATASANDIRFIKIYDKYNSFCTSPIKKPDPNASTELIDKGQFNLAIQSFSIASYDSATNNITGQQLYSIKFYLGTNDQSALTAGGLQCKDPGTAGADPSYCSINQFNVLARTGNVVK